MLRRLDSAGADFEAQLRELTAGDDDDTAAVAEQVAQILRAVRERGDAALLEYTATFDGYAVTDAAALELPPARLHDALARLERAAALASPASAPARTANAFAVDDVVGPPAVPVGAARRVAAAFPPQPAPRVVQRELRAPEGRSIRNVFTGQLKGDAIKC